MYLVKLTFHPFVTYNTSGYRCNTKRWLPNGATAKLITYCWGKQVALFVQKTTSIRGFTYHSALNDSCPFLPKFLLPSIAELTRCIKAIVITEEYCAGSIRFIHGNLPLHVFECVGFIPVLHLERYGKEKKNMKLHACMCTSEILKGLSQKG